MQTDFESRRNALLAQINTDSFIAIANAPEVIRNGSLHYPYHPRSHFYYLTGCDEPNAILLLTNMANKPTFTLFCREKKDILVNWSIPPMGLQKACSEYGADAAYAISEFESHLTKHLAQCCYFYCLLQEDTEMMHRLYQPRFASVTVPTHWIDVAPYIRTMRAIKTPSEIACLRQAAIISAKAHQRAMHYCKPGLYEYEIAAELHHEFARNGCQTLAYDSIVAAGDNACILHYQRNSGCLRDGELLLVDAGCEYKYYTADVTRTFPINGKFQPRQKALYEIVLQAQVAAIQAIQPGVTWNQLNQLVDTMLTDGLITLGLLSPTLSKIERAAALRLFYPHQLGHHLGLDVHDGLTLASNATLEAGMVVTIEPGIYIPLNKQDVSPQWRGMGIRIEDDVLVTEADGEVLSEAAPKTIEAIESIMSH